MFIVWMIIQLVIIGGAFLERQNKILDKTYDCSDKHHSYLWGMMFPLGVFVPEPSYVKDYCEGFVSSY